MLFAAYLLYLDTKENKVYLTLGEVLTMIVIVMAPAFNTVATILFIIDKYQYKVVWRKKK
jgi:hypothetical protein